MLILCNVFGCLCCMKMLVCLCLHAISLRVVAYARRHPPVLFRWMLCFLSTLAVFYGRLWVSSPMQAFANSSGIYFYLSCSSWLPLIAFLFLFAYYAILFLQCVMWLQLLSSCYHLQLWISHIFSQTATKINLCSQFLCKSVKFILILALLFLLLISFCFVCLWCLQSTLFLTSSTSQCSTRDQKSILTHLPTSYPVTNHVYKFFLLRGLRNPLAVKTCSLDILGEINVE